MFEKKVEVAYFRRLKDKENMAYLIYLSKMLGRTESIFRTIEGDWKLVESQIGFAVFRGSWPIEMSHIT